MGVKNNFSQAVSELIGISKTADTEEHQEKEALVEEELLESDEVEMALEEEDLEEEFDDDDISSIIKVNAPASTNAVNANKEKIMAMLTQQASKSPVNEVAPVEQKRTEIMMEPKEAPGITTIARGTVIIGEINAEGDVELLGSVKGKVASVGDIRANGKVIGDLMGRDVELVSCAVQGNIIASGSVTVDGDSVVIGDVTSENFCLDGKIKGNVMVEKEAKFQPKAILAGNVTTASIAMSQGAKIQGAVNIPLSEQETDMTFDVDFKI